jgi:D-3-phosphoglycerate dehydrogenase
MPAIKILIVDTMHHSLLPLLATKGWEYDYVPNIKANEVLHQISDYQGIIIRSKLVIDIQFLDHATNLQFIARAGAGLDQIDLAEVKKRNIILLNAPEGNRHAVAEHTLAMLLSLFNNLIKANAEIKTKIWDREGNRGVELHGKTVSIIGYGNMGSSVAKCLSGFGCRVLAYDKYHDRFKDGFAESVTMETIFAETDILSLHIPLTKETNNLLNINYIAQFQKPFYLVNTARGEIVNLADLEQSLANGKILGACLDVLENEKLATLTPIQAQIFEKLASSNKVIFSPHVAGWTHESYIKINEVLVEKIAKIYIS